MRKFRTPQVARLLLSGLIAWMPFSVFCGNALAQANAGQAGSGYQDESSTDPEAQNSADESRPSNASRQTPRPDLESEEPAPSERTGEKESVTAEPTREQEPPGERVPSKRTRDKAQGARKTKRPVQHSPSRRGS